MIVMNFYYDEKTGLIKAYQGGGALSPADEIPPGCKRVAFPHNVVFTNDRGSIIMKFDVKTKQLIPLEDVKPLVEENSREYLLEELRVAEQDMAQADKEDLKEFRLFLRDKIEDIKLRLDQLAGASGTVEVTANV